MNAFLFCLQYCRDIQTKNAKSRLLDILKEQLQVINNTWCPKQWLTSTISEVNNLRRLNFPSNDRGRNSCKKILELKGKFANKLNIWVGGLGALRSKKISLVCPFKEFRTDAWVHSYVKPIVRKPILYITHSKMGLLQSQENVVLIAL